MTQSMDGDGDDDQDDDDGGSGDDDNMIPAVRLPHVWVMTLGMLASYLDQLEAPLSAVNGKLISSVLTGLQ